MNEFLETAEAAARRGGDVLAEWSDKFTVSEKSPKNLVTEADLASQSAIEELIALKFPEHGFLGEEGLNRVGSDPSFRWVVDPLDGTSNYVHRFPYYAVSIALEKDGELIAGAVFDPNRNEMFSAAAGEGATLNGSPITTSKTTELKEAMAMASLPVGAGPDNVAVERFLRVMPHVQTVQRTGSAALNLCSTACGRIECFFSGSLKAWDVAAGALIVREAGGTVSKLDGSELEIETPSLLASNGHLHGGMLELM